MAGGINGILDSAKRALIAQQYSIQVTGHNIANVNTLGYSRQRVHLTTSAPVDSMPGQLGTGVKPAEVQRFRDLFIDYQLRRESQALGRFDAASKSLEMVEGVLNEPNDFALSGILNEFWNSWEDLANDPTSQAARTVVIEEAASVVQAFRKLNADLTDLQLNLTSEINSDLAKLNATAATLAELNDRIVQAESKHQNANDLRDYRDTLLDELATLVNVSWQEQDNGSLTVYVGGLPLVEYDTANPLAMDQDAESGDAIIFFSGSGLEAKVEQGSLAGRIDVRDTQLPEYLMHLDQLAMALAEEINNRHLTGIDLNGDAGGLLFNDGCEGAKTLSLNSTVADDPNLIAVSADGNTGDGSLALEIAGLRSAAVAELGGASISEYYHTLVSRIGADSANSSRLVEQQETFVNQLENYRHSVTGVSIDEEMTNMILYEQAYQAAAKMIRVADEMLWTVINLK